MLKTDSSFIVLYTADIAATHQFYQSLGFDIQELEQDKVVVSGGSLELHFVLRSSEPYNDYKYIAKPGNFGHGIIFYMETTNMDEMQTIIINNNGTVKAQPFKNHWGYQELLFEDPNGYKFALYQSI